MIKKTPVSESAFIAVPLGVVLAVISEITGNKPIGAVGGVMIIAAFITLHIGDAMASRAKRAPTEKVSEPAPAPPPPPATPLPVGTSLVGVRIRHRDGISTVTEDLDTPMPQRTVAAVDAHGRPENLSVSVDEAGNVIEAAVPGSEWAAAEAI